VTGQFQRAHQIESTPDKQTFLRALRRIQPVQRAVVATMAILLRRIRAEARVAQFVSPQRPMHQEPEGRIIRPLPRQKFAPRSSPANAVSIASMAALSATA